MTRRALLTLLYLRSRCSQNENPLPSTTFSPSGHPPEWARQSGRPTAKASFIITRARSACTTSPPENRANCSPCRRCPRPQSRVPPAERFGWENRGVKEEAIQWAPGGHELLIASGGDIFLWRIASGGFQQLTATPVAERDAKLSPDGKQVVFRRQHDIYVLDLADKKEVRLTSNGSDTLWNGELDWVYPEELALGTAFWWSPDSTRIAYLQFDVSREPLYPHADLLGRKAIFEPERYPQVGDPNADVRLGVVSAAGGPTRWMDIGHTEDQYLVARVRWTPDGKRLAVERLNRIQNRLDLLACDAATGDASLLLQETDPHWINVNDDFRWLKDGDHFLWANERSGYRHLEVWHRDKGRSRPRPFDDPAIGKVKNVAGVDEAKGLADYTSNEAGTARNSSIQHWDRWLGESGSDAPPLREPIASPWPRAGHPISIRSPASSRRRCELCTRSTAQRLPFSARRTGSRSKLSRFCRRKSSPSRPLTARPDYTRASSAVAGFQPGKKYPAIVQVYGGPHAQSVRNAWSGVSWDQALAHKGFVIWELDNRGAGPRSLV